MNWLLIAVASSLTFGAGSFIFKLSADKGFKSPDILSGLYLSGSLVLMFSFFLTNKGIHWESFSLITLIAAIVIAIGSSLGNSLYLKVLKAGPASLSAPLINCSNLLVVIMSVLFFNEHLTLYMYAAIFLFFISIALLAFDPNEHLIIKDKQWYFLIIATIICIFFREGGLKIGHEIGLDTILILFCSYLYALCFNGYRSYKNKNKLALIQSNTKYGILFGLIVGLFSAGGLALYAKALSEGPASIVAPIFAARSFVVVVLSTWICKERLSRYQYTAIFLLLIALSLLWV